MTQLCNLVITQFSQIVCLSLTRSWGDLQFGWKSLLAFVSQCTESGRRIFRIVGWGGVALYSESFLTKDSLWVWNQPTDHAANTTNTHTFDKLEIYIWQIIKYIWQFVRLKASVSIWEFQFRQTLSSLLLKLLKCNIACIGLLGQSTLCPISFQEAQVNRT